MKQIPSMLGRMGVNNPFIVTDKFLEASLRFVPAVDAAVPRVVCLAPQPDHWPLAFDRATALSAKLRRRWRRAPCRIAPFLIRFLIPQRRPPTASVLTVGSCYACLPTDCDNAPRAGLSPSSAGSDPVSPFCQDSVDKVIESLKAGNHDSIIAGLDGESWNNEVTSRPSSWCAESTGSWPDLSLSTF